MLMIGVVCEHYLPTSKRAVVTARCFRIYIAKFDRLDVIGFGELAIPPDTRSLQRRASACDPDLSSATMREVPQRASGSYHERQMPADLRYDARGRCVWRLGIAGLR